MKFVNKSDLNRKFIAFCIKKRLGRTNFSLKVIYFITSVLGRFEVHKNTNDFSKRGHYIPKFLLRRFRILESGPQKGMIYQYNFSKNSITEEPINKIAQLTDFYIFKKKGGGHSDYVEKEIFANFIENFGSQVIKTINQSEDDPDLTILEQNVLATFISHQITRTPAFYFNLRKYILFLYEKKLLKIEDLGSSEFMNEVIVKNKYNVTYEDMINFIPQNSIGGDENHLGHIARLIASSITEEIFRFNFNFIHVPDGSTEEFVISDNPIVFMDFSSHEIKKFPVWWDIRNKDTWIFIPISYKKCLCLTTQIRKDGRVEKEYQDIIEAVNFGQYLNSLNYLYGRSKTTIEKHLKLFIPELLKHKLHVVSPEDIFKS